MTEPNAQLMELYGTKVAAAKAVAEGVPTAVQIAAAIMGFGFLMGERGRVEEEQARHAEREELARALEEERMRPVLESFGKTGSADLARGIGQYMAKVAALNTAIEKLASGDSDLTPYERDVAAQHFLAKLAAGGPESLSEMEKEAIAPLLGSFGTLGRAAARARSAVQRGFTRVFRPYGGTGRTTRSGGQLLESTPAAAAKPAGTVAAPGAAAPAAAAKASPAGAVAGPPAGAAAGGARSGAVAETIPAPTTASTMASPAGAVAAPAGGAETAKAIQQTTQQAGKGKGKGGIGWKGKLLAGGAVGAGGDGMYRAGQAATNYMMIPTQQTQQWGFGPRARPTVSPYGYSY